MFQNVVLLKMLSLIYPRHLTIVEKNIITDDYFTELFLEVNLLQNAFTLVGTVRKNKTIVPANFLQFSRREVYSWTFSFQRNITFMSDVSKKNKAVLILSGMHLDLEITNEDIRQPKINLFRN